MTMPPITIPDLDPAGPINKAVDQVIVRQGLNDKRATVAQVSQIDLTPYPFLPGSIVASDVFLIGRNVASQYITYIATQENVTFLSGTQMWFYSSAAPLGWTTVPNTGDRVLGTILPGGATFTYHGVGAQGNWQQSDWTLTLDQIPSHTHGVGIFQSASDSSNGAGPGKKPKGGTETSDPSGGGKAHNHGNQWRPAAAVGIIARKN